MRQRMPIAPDAEGASGMIGPVARTPDTRGGDRHKGDPQRAVRVSDELWDAVAMQATEKGLTRREAVIEALEKWVGWQ